MKYYVFTFFILINYSFAQDYEKEYVASNCTTFNYDHNKDPKIQDLRDEYIKKKT